MYKKIPWCCAKRCRTPDSISELPIPCNRPLVPAMDVLIHSAASRFPVPRPHRPFRTSLRQCVFSVRSSFSLPFSEQKAKYYEHLQAAVDVVERACRLCIDVQKSLFSSDGKIIQKLDRTPVTIADFGVQALVSLEMSKLFPSIPLVAEEDSAFVRENNLVDAVVQVVADKSSISNKALSQEDVLKAIDRGGKDAYSFGPEPATYWHSSYVKILAPENFLACLEGEPYKEESLRDLKVGSHFKAWSLIPCITLIPAWYAALLIYLKSINQNDERLLKLRTIPKTESTIARMIKCFQL